MRNLVLTLLLANLLMLGWQAWVIPPDPQDNELELPKDYSELVSVREPEPVPDAEAMTAAAEETDTGEIRCVRVGPFGRESDVGRVRTGLMDQGVPVTQTSEQGDIWVGHWVRIKNLGDREAAEAAVQRLAANGMRDAYIVAGEEPSISLGVFRKRASVEIVATKAGGLGFETVTTDRYQPGTNYWLEAQLTDIQALPLRKLLKDMGQILRTEAIDCGEPA